MSDLRPVTVITGASSGIGAALARVFARNGHELALVARREDRLRALADEIAAAGGAKPLVIPADLQRDGAARALGEALAAQGAEPQYLVNNAGFGLVGGAATLERAEQMDMIDLNVRALADLSLAFVDSLARHRGGILNVGSMAGFLPGPGMAVYYATKAFVLSFSEALHSELEIARRAGVRALSGAGADRIRRTGRHQRQLAGARFSHPIGGICGGSRLPRADGGAAHGHPGVVQPADHHDDPLRAAPSAAGSPRPPPAPAQVRAAGIAGNDRRYCKRRQSG